MPAVPCGGTDTGQAFGLHTTVPVSVPAVHVYEPDSVYPVLHIGAHERPLASVAEHVPASPLVTAADASQGVDVGARVSPGAMHTTVLVVSTPAAHVLVPVSVYPLLHVGVHELPLARLDVHVPASPFVGAADASHGQGELAHPG